jgi:N-acetylmuramoyl-L-alanine amidase
MIDATQSLKDRVIIANSAKADFFLSIHHNSTINMPEVKGIETYYSSAEQGDDFKGGAVLNKLEISKKMATVINDSIAKNLNLNNRGIKDSQLFIRSTNMPSIVVEAGFITNEEEAKRCADPIIQQKIAETIADAIKANI